VRPGLLGVVCTVDAAGRPQIVRHWGVRARAVADELEFYLCAAASVPCLLHERTNALRIEKNGRGRYRLEVARELVLERRP